MCKILTISNQKGGVGKTTTAISLAVSLANMGKKVLCVDLDPQSNLTMALGYLQPDEIETTIVTLLTEEINNRMVMGCKQPTHSDNYILSSNGIDFIPANIELAGFENVLMNTMSRESVLKNFLERHRPNYDYILIDTLPSLNILTVNALNASDAVIIPVQAQFFSLKGLELLLQTISSVKNNLNKNLEIAGILVTMFDKRINLQKQAVAILEENYGQYINIFASKISMSAKVNESQGKGVTVFDIKNNIVAEQYGEIAHDLLHKERAKDTPRSRRAAILRSPKELLANG